MFEFILGKDTEYKKEDDVGSGGQLEPPGQLSQVHKGLASRTTSIVSEEVCVEMALFSPSQSVNTKPNGEKLEALVHQGSPPLLHKVDDHRALLLLVPIVGVLEADHELGVHCEGGQAVPATPRTLPGYPGPGESGHLPLKRAAIVEGVWGQVGHLQLVEVLEEVLEGHPPLTVRLPRTLP